VVCCKFDPNHDQARSALTPKKRAASETDDFESSVKPTPKGKKAKSDTAPKKSRTPKGKTVGDYRGSDFSESDSRVSVQ